MPLILFACQVSEEELSVTLLALGFDEERRKILLQHLQSQILSKQDLRPLQLSTPHYKNIQWRLEAKVKIKKYLFYSSLKIE